MFSQQSDSILSPVKQSSQMWSEADRTTLTSRQLQTERDYLSEFKVAADLTTLKEQRLTP